MPTVKNKLIANTTAVSVGCGRNCRRINLSELFHPKPTKHTRNRNYHHHHHHDSSISPSTSSNTTPTATTATLSPNISDVRSSRSVQGFGSVTLAVEKDSDDPYVDFRESMLQMITEEEIYKTDDLRELLNCFLQLNSPYYHPIIVRAFTEIWNNISN